MELRDKVIDFIDRLEKSEDKYEANRLYDEIDYMVWSIFANRMNHILRSKES